MGRRERPRTRSGVCRKAGILSGRAAAGERERLKDFRNVESGWMWLRRAEWLGPLPAPSYLQAVT